MKINNKRGDMMKGRGKRGQAAMEFLMTYGWAILVVLIAIGALVYFGVLSPERFISDQCTLSAPLSCSRQGDFLVTGATGLTQLKVQNGAGSSITIVDATGAASVNGFEVKPTSTGIPCTPNAANPTTIADGAKADFSFTCPTLTPGDKARYDLKINYVVGAIGGYTQVSSGRLVATAQ